MHDNSIVLQADYRLDGKEELICCSADGEVRGYLPASQETLQRGAVGGPGMVVVAEQKRLEELNQMKQVCVNLIPGVPTAIRGELSKREGNLWREGKRRKGAMWEDLRAASEVEEGM